jgi:hypothetical protein
MASRGGASADVSPNVREVTLTGIGQLLAQAADLGLDVVRG